MHQVRFLAWLSVAVMGLVALPAVKAQQEELPPRRFALLVGVHQYRAGQPLNPLPLAENDAHDLAQVLRRAGYRVTLLSQRLAQQKSDIRLLPLRDNILDSLELILSAPHLNHKDTVLVALAGHGGEFRVQDADEPKKTKHIFCFLPQDADLKGLKALYDQDKLPTLAQLRDKYRLLPLVDLYGPLQQCRAGTRLLWVDACRNDPAVEEFRSPSRALPLLPPPPGGLGLLMSCSQGQRAVEDRQLGHGVFFHFVIEGLKGQADLNQNGLITLSELNGFVADRVHDYVKKKYRTQQTPEFKGVLRRVVLVPEVKKLLPPVLKAPFTAQQAQEAQKRWAQRLDTPVVKTNSIGMKLVLIPPGEFQMGSTREEVDQTAKNVAEVVVKSLRELGVLEEAAAAAEKAAKDIRIVCESELPRHRVRITRPFYLGMHEVTVGQFRKFVQETGYRTEAETDGKGGWGYNAEKNKLERSPKYTWRDPGFPQTDDHPVVNVSWNDAQAFCRWLSRKEGVTYRLPTEAQWEYACRAGTTTRWYHGDNAEGLAQVGNVADQALTRIDPFIFWAISANDGFVFTAPVGQFRANAFGLYDMHGNVWEWCQDWYDAEFYSRSPLEDPVNNRTGKSRVLRGGSWLDVPWGTRSANRYRVTPVSRYLPVGFRVARVVE